MDSPRRVKLPVARVERHRLKNLATTEREILIDEVYALWSHFFDGMDRARFVETHLFDETVIRLARNAAGEVVGFFNYNLSTVRVAGRWRSLSMITSGLFTRPDHDAARPLLFHGLRECFRTWIRRPWISLSAVPVATTPVIYRLFARQAWRLQPHPQQRPPHWLPSALATLAQRRGLSVDAADPFVTRFFVRQRQVQALKGARAMQHPTASMRFFESRVPEWANGQAVMVWIPLGPLQLLGTAWKIRRRRALDRKAPRS